MRGIVERLWLEPAYFVAAIVAVLTVVVAALPVGGTARTLVTAALVVLGGGATRPLVTPTRKAP